MDLRVTERITFIIYVIVDKVEKIGDLWYAHFIGSWESIAFGTEKPFEVGDEIEISFRKVNRDKNQETA